MKFFRKRKIIYGCAARGDAQSAYLTRWEPFSCSLFAIYLHRFERSDDRSSLHDHPWNFITIPLRHRYNDCQFNGGVDELGQQKKAWTLVLRFKYIRYCGFWQRGIFTVFYDYFTQNGC